jgi:hypothetical protein
MVCLDDREPLAALAAVVDRLIDGRAGAQSGAERGGVGVITVQVGEEAGNRSRLGGHDFRERDRPSALPQPREHGCRVPEWIDHHPLALRLDLHAGPAKPPDPHVSSINSDKQNDRPQYIRNDRPV